MQRLESIERPTLKAIAAAESEKEGLEQRMMRAQNHASLLMGNDAAEYLDRDPEVERRLSDEERTMMAAQTRIRQLGVHLDHLHRVLALLRQRQA